jgi:hypothetical protein
LAGRHSTVPHIERTEPRGIGVPLAICVALAVFLAGCGEHRTLDAAPRTDISLPRIVGALLVDRIEVFGESPDRGKPGSVYALYVVSDPRRADLVAPDGLAAEGFSVEEGMAPDSWATAAVHRREAEGEVGSFPRFASSAGRFEADVVLELRHRIRKPVSSYVVLEMF